MPGSTTPETAIPECRERRGANAGAIPACPRCSERVLYNGHGYSCICCSYTRPFLARTPAPSSNPAAEKAHDEAHDLLKRTCSSWA
jgi:hypothetical protein